MGDGTLPEEKFNVYFQQDYLFLRDWIALMCGGIAKAPDYASARPLAAFVHGALQGEEGLFQQFFSDTLACPRTEVRDLKHLPTSFAHSGFLRKNCRGMAPSMRSVTALLGIEWPYLDWANRLAAAGKRPANRYYQAWIDVHASKELDEFVSWLRTVLDTAVVADVGRLKDVFLTTLRYEYLF